MNNTNPYIQLPLSFVDKHLKTAPHSYTVIYIYIFSMVSTGKKTLSTSTIAKDLFLTERDIENAISYWKDLGLVHIYVDENKNMIFEFPNSENFSLESEPMPAMVSIPTYTQGIVLERKPTYSPEELEVYSNSSEEIRELNKAAESALGKLLSYNDLNTIYSFYDWLRLPSDVIILLITYCAENGNRNMRYIEKVAIDWADKGINTVEKASTHIEMFNGDFRQIQKAMGNQNRELTSSEIKYIEKWFNQYNFTLDIILEACDKTIMQASKPTYKYLDKILTSWYENSVKTIDDIIKLENAYYETKETKKNATKSSATKKKTTKKSKFDNFNQKDWDFAELYKLEQKRILSDLKEGDSNE